MSAQTGGDQVLITKDDKARIKGPFWIGVRGHKGPAMYTISVLKGTRCIGRSLLNIVGTQSQKLRKIQRKCHQRLKREMFSLQIQHPMWHQDLILYAVNIGKTLSRSNSAYVHSYTV